MVCSSCVCFFKLAISVNGCLFLYVTLWFKGGAWGGWTVQGVPHLRVATAGTGSSIPPLFSPLSAVSPIHFFLPLSSQGVTLILDLLEISSCWAVESFFSPLCSKVLLRVWFSNHQSLFQQGFCFSLSNSNTVLYVCTANRLKRRI